MDRGYTLNRGKGMKRPRPNKAICPNCGKRGIGQWRAVSTILFTGIMRECRYCQRTETKAKVLGPDVTDLERLKRDAEEAAARFHQARAAVATAEAELGVAHRASIAAYELLANEETRAAVATKAAS